MFKTFVLKEIKKYLFVGIISAIVMTVFFVPFVANAKTSADKFIPASFISNGLLGLTIATVIVSFAAPLFIYSYKYSLKNVDLYYQAPYSKKKIKLTRNIIILSYVLLAFIIAYLIGILTISIKNATSINEPNRIYYDIGKYFLALPFYLLLIVFEFSFSSYLCSKGNAFVDSMLIDLGGHIITVGLYFAFCLYVDAIVYIPSGLTSGGGSVIFASIEIVTKFSNLIVSNPECAVNLGEAEVPFLVSSIVFTVIGILSIIGILYSKDPSGEYAGKGKNNNVVTQTIYHLTFATLGIFVAATSAIGIAFSLAFAFVLWLLSYYLIGSLLRRSMKFNKKEIIKMLPLVIIILGLLVTSIIIRGPSELDTLFV